MMKRMQPGDEEFYNCPVKSAPTKINRTLAFLKKVPQSARVISKIEEQICHSIIITFTIVKIIS